MVFRVQLKNVWAEEPGIRGSIFFPALELIFNKLFLFPSLVKALALSIHLGKEGEDLGF